MYLGSDVLTSDIAYKNMDKIYEEFGLDWGIIFELLI